MIREKNKYDNFILGLIAGIIVPLIITVIVIAIQSKGTGFIEYSKKLMSFGLHADILRVTALVDLLVFYLFLNKKLYKAVKGVILGVLIVGLYVVYIKFL